MRMLLCCEQERGSRSRREGKDGWIVVGQSADVRAAGIHASVLRKAVGWAWI